MINILFVSKLVAFTFTWKVMSSPSVNKDEKSFACKSSVMTIRCERLSQGDSGFIVQNIKSAGIVAIFACEHQTIS